MTTGNLSYDQHLRELEERWEAGYAAAAQDLHEARNALREIASSPEYGYKARLVAGTALRLTTHETTHGSADGQ